MEAHRLRAPATDGALLAEPPLPAVRQLLAVDRQRLNRWDHDFQGRRATDLRVLVRDQVLGLSRSFLSAAGLDTRADAGADRSGPLIVTGHQPELFHPGVWVKNFAAYRIAAESGGVGLNLIVDNDVPKSADVKVPRERGGALVVERVQFDDRRGEAPYEALSVQDEDLFGSFGARVKCALEGLVDDPIIDEYWPRAVSFRDRTSNPGLRFALARRAVEASWGVRNAEVPLSAVCETEGFHWFASHLLAHLPRFQRVHNDALDRYRRLYHIRSRNHPVPGLTAQGDWLEAPFWVWRDSAPRRHPLLARQLARTMQLRIGGEEEVMAEIPLAPDREGCCAVERLQALASSGVRIRTRALTTTMFARYLLGDLFLHGIGGSKYDELGDAISGRFFGIEPPAYLTLSLTHWLGLPADPTASERLKALEREGRDLVYNPDRHLGGGAVVGACAAVEAKRRALNLPVGSHAERIARFRAIRRANEELQRYVADQQDELTREREGLSRSVRRNGVALSRDYAAVLHSRARFRAALTRALPGLRLA